MGAVERRTKIMQTLSRRKHETIANLAYEFGVSPRTILRDIAVLSISEPIYTQCGRYNGGVYVAKDYCLKHMYMSESELDVLNRINSSANSGSICELNNTEKQVLQSIIAQYTKPSTRKEKPL